MLQSLVIHCPCLTNISITGLTTYFNGSCRFSSDFLDSPLLQSSGGVTNVLSSISAARKYLETMHFSNIKERLTIALVNGMEVSAQLIYYLNNSLSSIKNIDLEKCTFCYDSHRNVNLDFSRYDVDRFDLDVSRLYFSSRTHFFCY